MKMINNKIRILILFSVYSISLMHGMQYYKNNPTPGEITILASSPIPSGLEGTHQSYQDIVECGFNLGMEAGDISYFKKQFEAIGDLNFKYLIDNAEIRTAKRKEWIDEFKDSKYFGGWKFKDEPKFEDLEKLSKEYKILYDANPNTFIYINLIGGINKIFTGEIKTYPEYLDLIQKKFNPEVWSYDQYPIEIKNGKVRANLESFYYDFECFRNISLRTKRPFWAYCLSMAFENKNEKKPAATEPYLRFEAFSALAYGAQGIVYWTYGQRKSNNVEKYLSALVNMDGKKTKAWYAAKKVNGEIKKFNNVFYGCEVKEIKHTGDKLYRGTRKLDGEYGPFKIVRSGEAGVIVSLIENQGEKYVVIVSRDIFKKQKITLELKPNLGLMNISSDKQITYSWRKDVKITLDKGGYVILKQLAE